MIIRNPQTYQGLEILCRVYENQNRYYWLDPHRDESKQICVEVLFSNESGIDEENKQAYAWLPIGAAEFIVQNIKTYINTKRIGICNELPYHVGVLTSVNTSFESAFDRVLREYSNVGN